MSVTTVSINAESLRYCMSLGDRSAEDVIADGLLFLCDAHELFMRDMPRYRAKIAVTEGATIESAFEAWALEIWKLGLAELHERPPVEVVSLNPDAQELHAKLSQILPWTVDRLALLGCYAEQQAREDHAEGRDPMRFWREAWRYEGVASRPILRIAAERARREANRMKRGGKRRRGG